MAVLCRIAGGAYPALVATELGLSRQAVDYHIRALLSKGIIGLDKARTAVFHDTLGGPSKVTLYGLTGKGRELFHRLKLAPSVDPLTRSSRGGEKGVKERPPTRLIADVHGFEVKIPVKKWGVWLPDQVSMKNWTKEMQRDFFGVTIVKNGKTDITIQLFAAAQGADLEEAKGRCYAKLLNVMDLLEHEMGVELGRPQFRYDLGPGRTKIGVLNHPKGKILGPQNGKLGMIDKTPGDGTIHTYREHGVDDLIEEAENARVARLNTDLLVEAFTKWMEADIPEKQALTEYFRAATSAQNGHPPPPDERRDVT